MTKNIEALAEFGESEILDRVEGSLREVNIAFGLWFLVDRTPIKLAKLKMANQNYLKYLKLADQHGLDTLNYQREYSRVVKQYSKMTGEKEISALRVEDVFKNVKDFREIEIKNDN
ncbi:MAG: hypothetical protein AABX99_02770 [Nanoarchaeota archaeon]